MEVVEPGKGLVIWQIVSIGLVILFIILIWKLYKFLKAKNKIDK